MFRKNYVPKLRIKQDFDTKKWFAYKVGDTFDFRSFVQLRDKTDKVYYATVDRHESLSYGLVRYYDPTRFDSLDDLLAAIYEYAYTEHLEYIKRSLTNRSVSVST